MLSQTTVWDNGLKYYYYNRNGNAVSRILPNTNLSENENTKLKRKLTNNNIVDNDNASNTNPTYSNLKKLALKTLNEHYKTLKTL